MNFDYIKQYSVFKNLYDNCRDAEGFALSRPNISVTSARKAMEFIVKFIYSSKVGNIEYKLTTFEMLQDYRFQDYINDQYLLNTLHYIRKMGNVAAHDNKLYSDDALKVLEELHFLVGEFFILLGLVDDYPEYEKPGRTVLKKENEVEPKDIKKIVQEPVTVSPELVAKFGPRMAMVTFNVKEGRDEEENKKLFMHACLREAGWPIINQNNQAMPAAVGVNMILDSSDTVDYILYGRDNKPLAIIEYTATKDNLVEGRLKGIAKANELSVKLGYKPIVYYTNGYHIFVIDQLGYKPRRVFQFHSIEELELLKLRATIRKDISDPAIDDTITNRDYQKEAIKASCNAFMQNRRHSLLVMATGTGKTRVSISLVDVLMKANWVKNVLFLADRTSLVRQAHKNFNKLLPNVTTSIYAGGITEKDPNSRIIFSTYQTMINLINDDTREFGIGRFDLIIIDEAHRSIFKKYSALFHYFDSLMIGLTATPRSENNKSTYQMFELPDGNPDYAYELEEAIEGGYLVGFSVEDKTTDVMRRGIYYDELTDEEKESFEDSFANSLDELVDYTGAVVDAHSVKNKTIINIGTIDVMLNDLMKNGLRVDGGDKIGKTIIFAGSHYEAEIIVERFYKLYPYLGLDFCKLIDSQVANNLSLIDNFGERKNLPQIAVSVDMMDTGIDVPDVLNLVFFKSVKSKIKFLQMIGRGTRLSPDIFGPTLDKQGFIIFDYYDNFNYFRATGSWTSSQGDVNGRSFNAVPQSILINQRKLGILRTLTESQCNTFEAEYRDELKEYFISSVRSLCTDDIEVQYNMPYVSKYRTAEQWDSFTFEKVTEISKHILPLFPSIGDPVKVKAFDHMMFVLEDEIPKRAIEGKDIRKIRHGFGNIGTKIDDMMVELLKLKTIPAIVSKEVLINNMRNADLIFDNFSLELCEDVRKELRDLMQYIPDDVKYYVINTKDFIIDEGNSQVEREKTYAEKAEEFIESGYPAFAKIRNLDELTEEEKQELEEKFKSFGTETDYIAWTDSKPLLPFLRVKTGIADEAIQTKFSAFYNTNVLNEQQLTYIEQIISYTRENGDIVFLDLQRVSPFCDIDVVDLFGANIVHIKTLINGLHKPVI